jgi:phosphoribosylformylglycinamidine synthase
MGNQSDIFRIAIQELRPGARSQAVILQAVRRLGLEKVCAVQRSELYFVRGNIAPGELELLGRFLFSDPVTQRFEVQSVNDVDELDTQSVEIAYHVGVTDPVADEIVRSARELGVEGIDAAMTAQRYEFFCRSESKLSSAELETVARKILANPVVQRFAKGRLTPAFPQSVAGSINVDRIPIHTMSDAECSALDKERRSALDPEELRAIRDYFKAEGRPCTDVEFEMIAQTWSEHCFHKTFKAIIDVEGSESGELPARVDNILKTYIKMATDTIAAPWVVSAFKDNAGIIEFDDDFDLSFKVETHNHPSAIEPFGGANTGVGGVIRDVMAVSARPIAVTDILCFGFPEYMGRENKGLEGSVRVDQIRSGVVAGVQDYGNKMGIPTVNGGIHYHEKYATNPLVYCGCVGLAPKGSFFSRPAIGDRILVLGGKTGRDGIRGATFSSMTMDDATLETAGSSVQIGAPIVEKKVSEVILAARDAGLYSGITDCGAGGLSSAVGEMASELGADVELSNVELKYPGLAPWEIWLSEAQERMVLSVHPDRLHDMISLCDSYDVGYCDLGSFTGDGRLVVRYKEDKVLDLTCSFLHEGMPRRKLSAKNPIKDFALSPDISAHTTASRGSPQVDSAHIDAASFATLLSRVMAHHAIASKEWAIRRYDHEVQGGTRGGPFSGRMQKGPSDAAVLQPFETKSGKAVAVSNGFNPRYAEADSYNAAFSALDEAVRNAVAVGADPDRIAVTDNFCWGDPRRPENLWTLLRSAKACHDAAIAHRTPFISGKDSFNNEFEGADGSRVSIPPSLLISAVGIVPDVRKAVATDLKADGSSLYLVGEFYPVLSASVLMDILGKETEQSTDVAQGSKRGPTPSLRAPEVYRKLHAAINSGMVKSCHDLSDGGFCAAISEMCLGGERGAILNLSSLRKAAELFLPSGEMPCDSLLLLGETNGCLIAEVAASESAAFETMFLGFPCHAVGTTTALQDLVIQNCSFSDGLGEVRTSLSVIEKAFRAEIDETLRDVVCLEEMKGGVS